MTKPIIISDVDYIRDKLKEIEIKQEIKIPKHVEKTFDKINRYSNKELFQMRNNCLSKLKNNIHGLKGLKSAIFLIDGIERELNIRKRELNIKKDGYFKFPTTNAPDGKKDLKVTRWTDRGILREMGYQVGYNNGVIKNVRINILDVIFFYEIPFLNDKDYVEEWGDPKSSDRLKKMAETIAALTRNAKRKNNNNYKKAIKDWEEDLSYIYKKYYVGFFNFEWPATSTE